MLEPTEQVRPDSVGLREAGENYQQLVELSPDAIVVEVDDRIAFANAASLEMFAAHSFDQLIGHSFAEFLHPESNLLLRQRVVALREAGEPVPTLELQIVRMDHSTAKVDAAAGLLMWRGANAVQIRLRQSKPTATENQLRESSECFHQLADSMPQIVWCATPEGVVDYHNQKWFEQTGLTEEEANKVGVWKAVLHPADAPGAAEHWEHCVRVGKPFQLEYRYKDPKSGGYRWHLGRALPVRDRQNRIVRWFGTCTDIHDHKLAEIALQEAKDQLADNAAQLEKRIAERTVELQETVRSAEALNYSIAHDLRAPLRAMFGFSKALLDDHAAKLDPDGQEYARRIADSARRMDNLINALLAYGRLNYEELSFGFVNIQALLDSLLRDYEPEISQAKAQVRLTKPFPDVWADAVALKKVFIELIDNAFKFRDPKRPLEIDIWAEEKEANNLIWICDNGIGIPPEHHERVFRVLESLHDRNKYPGTGIGLAIVRRAVERMGGRIGLESNTNRRSCFWIELPKPLV